MCTQKVLQLINLGASMRQASVAGHSEQGVQVGGRCCRAVRPHTESRCCVQPERKLLKASGS